MNVHHWSAAFTMSRLRDVRTFILVFPSAVLHSDSPTCSYQEADGSQPVSRLYMCADWTVLSLCRYLRRCCPGSITTGTKGSLCCRSCCRRSDFLCVDLSSWRIESSRTASYAAAISAGETQVLLVLWVPVLVVVLLLASLLSVCGVFCPLSEIW